MDGVDGDAAAAVDGSQRGDDDVAGGGEGYRAVERHRRQLVVGAGPLRSHAARPLLLPRRPRADVDVAAPVQRDLDREQGGGAEAVEAEPAARLDARALERAVADDAAAKERRRLKVAEAFGETQREVGADGDVVLVAAVAVPAGEAGLGAEVLAAGQTLGALAARRRQPADARAVADLPAVDAFADGLDASHYLVSGHDR